MDRNTGLQFEVIDELLKNLKLLDIIPSYLHFKLLTVIDCRASSMAGERKRS